MYNQNNSAADDDQVIAQEHVGELPSEPTSSLDLDDAFSDGEDIEPQYELSLTAIRADLARAVSFSQGDEVPGNAKESLDIDIAASSVCIPVTLRGSKPERLAGILCHRPQRAANSMQNLILCHSQRVLSRM
jgi:hypothetical protein